MIEVKVTINTPDILAAAGVLAAAMTARAATAPAEVTAPIEEAPAAEKKATTKKKAATKSTKASEQASEPVKAETPAETAPAAPPVDKTASVAPPAPVPAAPAPAAPAPAPAPVKEYTLDDLSRAGAILIDRGFMNQILAIMKELNVSSILDLPKDLYKTCADKFLALDPKAFDGGTV